MIQLTQHDRFSQTLSAAGEAEQLPKNRQKIDVYIADNPAVKKHPVT